MPGMMSIGGIASGLQTDQIIAKIMEYARRPQAKLLENKADAQQRLAAWQDLNTRVLALKMKADTVADASDFGLLQATSSDDAIVTATASSTATPGTYYVKVTSRAQAHQVSTQPGAYTSVNDIVGTGTVHIELTNGTRFDVTLDANNSNLAGLRDAINRADKGIEAAIINAGTTTSPDYRLLLTSETPGTATQMTVLDTSGLTGGTAPVFNLANPVQAATSAVVEMGEGAGRITVTRDSNQVADLIPGVTLNVLAADPGQTIRIDVTRDTAAIKTAIQDFVAQYNSLADAIDKQFDYDAQSGASGVLMGDYQLQAVQMDLESTMTAVVDGLTSDYKALSTIGISLDFGGHLAIDDEQLTDALENHISDVAKVFGTNMESESSYVSLLTSTTDTRTSGADGWEVVVTQPATRSEVTAGTAMLTPLGADESVTVNGVGISLESGWDIDDVIAEINRHTAETTVVATKTGADGTGTGNYLTFRSSYYGSSRTVSLASGSSITLGNTTGIGNRLVTPSAPLGEGDVGHGAAGLDVVGTINGEAATGKGQTLSLNLQNSTNAAKGLALTITATTAMTTRVILTKGAGASIRDLLTQATSSTGVITTAQNGINGLIEDIADSIASMESRLLDQEARLYAQFNAMEGQLAKLQQQGSYLSSQLSAMNGGKK